MSSWWLSVRRMRWQCLSRWVSPLLTSGCVTEKEKTIYRRRHDVRVAWVIGHSLSRRLLKKTQKTELEVYSSSFHLRCTSCSSFCVYYFYSSSLQLLLLPRKGVSSLDCFSSQESGVHSSESSIIPDDTRDKKETRYTQQSRKERKEKKRQSTELLLKFKEKLSKKYPDYFIPLYWVYRFLLFSLDLENCRRQKRQQKGKKICVTASWLTSSSLSWSFSWRRCCLLNRRSETG